MNKKSILIISGLFIVVAGLFASQVTAGQAYSPRQALATLTPTPKAAEVIPALPTAMQIMTGPSPTPTQVPEINSYKNSATFTFKYLNLPPDIILRYPSSYSFGVNLPDHWVIIGGSPDVNLDLPNPQAVQTNIKYSYLELHYDTSSTWMEARGANANRPGQAPVDTGFIPFVEVYIDEYLIGVFTPEIGVDHYVRLPLPAALAQERQFNPTNDRTIRIDYYRNNDYFCGYQGVIKIHDDSALRVFFVEAQPNLSLERFPSPVVFDSQIPETVPIILSDNLPDSELSAAAYVASTIGRKSVGNIKFKVLKASEATAAALANSNAIAIGQPGNNAFIKGLYQKGILPTSYSNGSIIYPPQKIGQDDGVLQLTSPEKNSIYSYLILTGSSDAAILNAAKALVKPTVGMKGPLNIAKPETKVDTPPNPQITYRFSDLDVTNDMVYYGVQSVTRYLGFYVPREWDIQDGASLVLNLNHSSNLSESNSSFTIELNGQPIGNFLLDANKGERQLVTPLRKEDIQVGTINYLGFSIIMSAPIACAPYDPTGTWVRIRNTSFIQLPHSLLTKTDKIKPFIHPFNYLANEQETAIALSPNPTREELSSMANMVFMLGRQKPYEREYSFVATTNGKSIPSAYEKYNVLAIGKPTDNPFVESINEFLPQPFVPGENSLKQDMGKVSYRIPSDISIGVIEVLPAPWNQTRGITLISGTTDDGIKNALKKASDPASLFDYIGDVSFIGKDTIESYRSSAPVPPNLDVVVSNVVGTHTVLEQVVPTATAGPTSTPVPEKIVRKSTTAESPLGIVLMIGLGIIGVIIAIFGITHTARGGRKL